MDVILTGLAPEVCPPGQQKQAMTFSVAPGTAYLGHHVAEALAVQKGDTIEMNGRKLRVERCLAESGEPGRHAYSMQLARMRRQILGLPGQISTIKAVDCLCFEKGDPVVTLRKEIGSVLPEAQVLQIKPLASARAKQRLMIHNIFAVMLPFVVMACGVWIAVLAIMNVRDRRPEIGLLRALGYDTARVMLLFLGKALLVGLFGAAAGFLRRHGAGPAIRPRRFRDHGQGHAAAGVLSVGSGPPSWRPCLRWSRALCRR